MLEQHCLSRSNLATNGRVESVKLLGEEIVDSVNYDGCENHSNPEPVYVALPPTLTL